MGREEEGGRNWFETDVRVNANWQKLGHIAATCRTPHQRTRPAGAVDATGDHTSRVIHGHTRMVIHGMTSDV